MNETHYRKLEHMYLGANINSRIFDTTKIEISEASAQISLNVDEKFFHALGAIHGSVYFKLLDDAAFFAVSSLVEDVFVLTVNFNIQLLRPVNEGVITAKGVVRFRSPNLYIAESVLVNEMGKEIAFGSGNFVRSKSPLTEEIGYR